MSIRYTARALAQLSEILGHIAVVNPNAARAVQARIKTSIENLGSFPFVGRATDLPGVRVLSIVRYPYRVFYRVQGDSDVLILRILHAARDQ
jgi:toxin ParE1/3/4